MTQRIPSAPVGPVGSSTAAPSRRKEGGAVLRDVALHHEPRVLASPAAMPRHRGGPAPQRPADVLEEGAGGADALEPAHERTSGPVGYGGQAEAASAYQLGFQAGRAEADGELQGARESAREAGYREGLERGLLEGREQGVLEGREAGRLEVERAARAAHEAVGMRLALLNQLLAELPAEMGRRLAGAEEEMVALSHAVVCRILGERLVTREGVVQHVAQALREAGGGGLPNTSDRQPVAVHVHPSDFASLQGDAAIAGWMAGGEPGGAAPIRWVPDERVRLGGCIVRSSEGTLDARIEVQMEALRHLLLASRAADAGRASGGVASMDAGPADPAGGRADA